MVSATRFPTPEMWCERQNDHFDQKYLLLIQHTEADNIRKQHTQNSQEKVRGLLYHGELCALFFAAVLSLLVVSAAMPDRDSRGLGVLEYFQRLR